MNTDTQFEKLQVKATDIKAGDRIYTWSGRSWWKALSNAPQAWFSTAERTMVVRVRTEGGFTPMLRADGLVTVSRRVA